MDEDSEGPTIGVNRFARSARRTGQEVPMATAAVYYAFPGTLVASIVAGPISALVAILLTHSPIVYVLTVPWCLLGVAYGGRPVAHRQIRRFVQAGGFEVPVEGWVAVDGTSLIFWPTGVWGPVKKEGVVQVPSAGWTMHGLSSATLTFRSPSGAMLTLAPNGKSNPGMSHDIARMRDTLGTS